MSRRSKKAPKKQLKSKQPKTLNLIHWIGRFGNRMFQVAYGKIYENRFGVEFRTVSKWEGDFLFKNCQSKLIQDEEFRKDLEDYGKMHSGHTLEKWEEIVNKNNKRTKSNLTFTYPYDPKFWGAGDVCMDCACWDSPFVFKQYTLKELRYIYEFSDQVKSTDLYKRAEDIQGTYDVAHLRRDDIMYSSSNHNWNYPAISKKSYKKAFWTFDVDEEKIVWISDDFPSYPSQGWVYPEGQKLMNEEPYYDFLPDFLKLYFARNIFRANSSFSWWGSCLSPTATVYSPILHNRVLYSETQKELNCEFIEGNTPHFMHVLGYAFGEEHNFKGFMDCPFINIKEK